MSIRGGNRIRRLELVRVQPDRSRKFADRVLVLAGMDPYKLRQHARLVAFHNDRLFLAPPLLRDEHVEARVSTAIDGADVTGSADDRRSGTLHSGPLATAEEDEVEVTRHRLMEALDLLGLAERGTVV